MTQLTFFESGPKTKNKPNEIKDFNEFVIMLKDNSKKYKADKAFFISEDCTEHDPNRNFSIGFPSNPLEQLRKCCSVIPSEIDQRIKKRLKVPEWKKRVSEEKKKLALMLDCDPDTITTYTSYQIY